jgi:hypothetical protein
MPEQAFLPLTDAVWMHLKDGDPSCLSMFLRHYTARQRRKIRQFVGPGEKMVLMTPNAHALFVWRKFKSDNGQTGVNCAVFRNEGGGLASDLIRAADTEAWQRWPGERLYTYVDPSKVRHKRDPGRCFLRAGWRKCGVTAKGLLILEIEGR